MKRFLILVYFISITSCLQAQNRIYEEKFKATVKNFYSHIYSDKDLLINDVYQIFDFGISEIEASAYDRLCGNTKYKCYSDSATISEIYSSPSVFFQFLKLNKSLVLADNDINYIIEKIDKSELVFINEKMAHVMIFDGNDGFIDFLVSEDEGEFRLNIVLSGGLSIYSLLMPNLTGKSHLVGSIDDPDGYTNLRSSPGVDQEIIRKVYENEIFIYWVTNKPSWWKVQTLDSCEIGYMHKSRIKPISVLDTTFDQSLRNKAQEVYNSRDLCR